MTVLQFRPKTPTNDDYHPLGTCPICRGNDGVMNIGRDHWGICETHKIAWHIGSNLFSGWQQQTEEDRNENLARLGRYKIHAPDRGPTVA